ncbi:MAG: hypothetical protein AAB225_31635 [Acidobacteriota bacterium]
MTGSRASLAAALVVALAGCAPAPKPAPKGTATPGEVKITHFYASPALLVQGEPVTVCYGVENARAVRIEPPVEELRPSYSRCIQVAPKRTTRYTLEAEGADGSSASQSVEVIVQTAAPTPPPPAPLIVDFVASAEETVAGQPVTLCYKVAAGASPRLEPEPPQFKPAEKGCFSVAPRQTTTYSLVATDAAGRSERRAVTIRVR